MPTVNGTLTDFGLDPMAGNRPRITFHPSGPALAGLNVHATKTVEVVPAANGYFEVDLVANDTVTPAMYYTVKLQWKDLEPRKERADVLPWRLYVPPAGGALGDLLATPSNPAQVWTGSTPPEDPAPGTWWLNPDTGDLTEWS